LLQIRVDFGDCDTDPSITLSDNATELHRDQDHEGHRGEHQTGQPGAQPKHDKHDETQDQKIAENRDQARGEELVQHVDIGSNACNQSPNRVAVVKGNVEFLQVLHQVAPQVK